jgi:hypothetical protein
MQNAPVADLSFYALVHHVLESSRESDESVERRTGSRRRYMCLQWLAPYREGHLPAQEDFSQVRCVDLSVNGFSFLVEGQPDYQYVVVALGDPASLFLSAEVVRRDVVPFEGENRLLFGCRFIARLDGSEYRPKLNAPVQGA